MESDIRMSDVSDRTILFSDKSRATVRAMEIYVDVSSSAQCSPAEIQGMLTMNAKMISTDLYRLAMISPASFWRWLYSLLYTASSEGENRADAAAMDVSKKAERLRTNSTVCITGSMPHLVCASFW